jgi:tetratricopeptide (TPR) repeat protein
MRILAIITLACSLVLQPVLADGGSSGSRNSRLEPFQRLIEQEKYQQAIDALEEALDKEPADADLLNLYAFSNRKLQRFDVALEYYSRALEIEPKHRGANEYLGELYLQLGDLEKAEQRLAVLDKACFFGCDEFDDLERAIEEYRKRNPS